MISASPAPIPLPSGVRQLVAFNDDGMALLSNGTVATWGDNSHGQIGAVQGTLASPRSSFLA